MSYRLKLELQTVGSCHVVLGIGPGPLEEQPGLLTAEPPLSPICNVSYYHTSKLMQVSLLLNLLTLLLNINFNVLTKF